MKTSSESSKKSARKSASLIKNLHRLERPRERCLEQGAAALSLRECLAVLIGSGPRHLGCLGLADQILERFGVVAAHPESEDAFYAAQGRHRFDAALNGCPGLGPANKGRLLAALDLARRFCEYELRHRQDVPAKTLSQLEQKCAQQIAPQRRAASREWFGYIPVFASGEVGTLVVVHEGAKNSEVPVDLGRLFSMILNVAPVGIYLAHNHPHGTLEFSPQDVQLTQEVKKLLASFAIHFLGHWLVTAESQRLFFNSHV